MTKKVVGVRLSEDLIERVDEYARRRSEAEPGLNMSRSQALKVLLEAGLLAAPGLKNSENEDQSKTRRTRRTKD